MDYFGQNYYHRDATSIDALDLEILWRCESAG